MAQPSDDLNTYTQNFFRLSFLRGNILDSVEAGFMHTSCWHQIENKI